MWQEINYFLFTALSFKYGYDCPLLWRATIIKPPSPKNNYGYSLQDRIVCGNAGRWGYAPTSGWIAFLGVLRSHNMEAGRPYRFAGFVRIWTKTGLFCGPKAK